MGDRKVVLEMGEWHATCNDCGWESYCWPRDGGINIVSQRAQLHTQLNPTHTVVVVDPASRVREVAASP